MPVQAIPSLHNGQCRESHSFPGQSIFQAKLYLPASHVSASSFQKLKMTSDFLQRHHKNACRIFSRLHLTHLHFFQEKNSAGFPSLFFFCSRIRHIEKRTVYLKVHTKVETEARKLVEE